MDLAATSERIKEAVGPAGLDRRPAGLEPYLRRGAAALSRRDAAGGAPGLDRRGRRGACGSAPRRACRSCRRAAIPGWSAAASRPQDRRQHRAGARPDEPRSARSTRINFTMTVEAGCILADLHKAAAAADRLFPLSLGAEGSCQIGGNLSTNAGGIAVLRYGNTRELVLGLEVVLPDGRVWDGLRGAAQGQYRLRSETALHRRRRHARHHHRRDAQAVPAAARHRDRVCRPRPHRGRDGAASPLPAPPAPTSSPPSS